MVGKPISEVYREYQYLLYVMLSLSLSIFHKM